MSSSPSAPPPSYDEIKFSSQPAPPQYPGSYNYAAPLNQQTTTYQGHQPLVQNQPTWVPPGAAAPITPVHHQMPAVQQTPVRVQQVAYIVEAAGPTIFGQFPSRINCPHCHQFAMSRVEHENTATTHLLALALCFLGFGCCFFVPYLLDTCKSAVHYCSLCNQYVGTQSRRF